MTAAPALVCHPDRLFPADPGVRGFARSLHALVADAPIISPHGHVDPGLLRDDQPFGDPATLLVTPDHYVTRLLHSHGVDLAALGVADAETPGAVVDPRSIWRLLCEHWAAFRATPSRFWLESELTDLFGIDVRPSAATADVIYDQIAALLATPAFRPQALFERFGIEVLATTDDPASDLAAHEQLAGSALGGRVLPTFRADRYIDPGEATWVERVRALGVVAGVDTGTYAGLVAALRHRREFFISRGATATDSGVADPGTQPLSDTEAEALHASAMAGPLPPAAAAAYRRNMIFQQGLASADDGLVMQLHPGVLRNHHGRSAARFGADIGADIPVATEFTRSLRPLLDAVGTSPTFRLVLFTVDETAFSREIAPLAGFYPSVYAGAPWWFIDTPDAITRYRASVTDTIGFAKTSGFIDDTRAFCSIPARHDMARRVDAAFLARLVAEHRLAEDEAADTIVDLVGPLPSRVFRLG